MKDPRHIHYSTGLTALHYSLLLALLKHVRPLLLKYHCYNDPSTPYGIWMATERTLLLEVNRMLNHLLNIGCHAGDLDALP